MSDSTRVRATETTANPVCLTAHACVLERAAAHERKKALKKALTEDADADALRGSPCSAHLSG